MTYSYEKTRTEDEIWAFEISQWNSVKSIKEQNYREKLEREARFKRQEELQTRLKEEEEREKLLTPEQKLYNEREKYYKNDVPKIIEKYKDESKTNRNTHNRLQWIIIIGSTIVTSTTGINIFTGSPIISYILKITAAIFSIIVSIAASFIGYFKYRERSMNLQKAADDIEHEYEAVKLGTHPYLNKSREQSLGLFADTVLNKIREQKEQQQILEQPPETKQLHLNT